MNRTVRAGGIGAGGALVGAGIGAIVLGARGLQEVRRSIRREKIVGTPDMHPDIAGRPIDTGGKAREFATGMRTQTLAITGGKTFSEMPRFLDADGRPTDDPVAAARDPDTGAPVRNAAREVWVTSTALQTALTTSFFAEQVATFSIVMGVAQVLTGTGFLVLVLSE